MTRFFQRFFSLRALCGIAACALAVAALLSCGGQASPPLPNTDSGQNGGGGGGGGGAPSLAMAGAYQGTLDNNDFVSFLTPAPELHWVGLYFNGNVGIYPDIYRGTLGNVTNSSASIANLTAYQFGDQLSTGNASITGASASNYQILLQGIGPTNRVGDTTFNASAITTYVSLPGTWTGRLTDNTGSYRDGLALTFNDTGVLTTFHPSYGNCPFSLSLSSAAASATPYYTARIEISPNTGCARSDGHLQATVLTGIAFIHDAPDAVHKRLEIILTDSTGSGISFRGDQ